MDKEILKKIINREASEEEKAYFVKFCKTHDLESTITNILEHEFYSNHEEDSTDIDALLSQIHIKIRDKKKSNKTRRFIDFNYYIKFAASIAIIVGVSVFFTYHFLNNLHHTEPVSIAMITKSTGYGQKLTFTLPDGSLVKLNSGSELVFPEVFLDSLREVWLDGEAYFVVQKDDKMPFAVNAGSTKTIVVGTTFNIFSRMGKTKIALEEGRVQVENTKKQILLLEPGQMAVHGESFQTVRFDPGNEFAWKEGRITLKKENIRDFAKKLEEWYGMDILFQENLVTENRTLSGSFNNESLENIIFGLCYSLDLDFKINKAKREVLIFNKK